MDSTEAIYFGLKDAGINFIVSVPCVNLSRLLEMIDEADFGKDTVLYMDYGQIELKYRDTKDIYAEVTAALMKKNVLLESRIVPKGKHNEASWEKAIPFFMKTLFYRL